MEEPTQPILTVILAARSPDTAVFQLCLSSLAALRNAPRIDLVIVAADNIPIVAEGIRSRLRQVKIIEREPSGVYDAYNRGLDEVHSGYVLFLGCDDIVLPGLDDVIEAIPSDQRPHIVAARSVMQDIGISGPSRYRWGLIFRNWCQQSILYRWDLFSAERFDVRYRMQADHKFNMEVVSNPKRVIMTHRGVITHFSSAGISQTVHDWVFRDDMPSIVGSCYGTVFGEIALVKRKLADIFKRRRRPD